MYSYYLVVGTVLEAARQRANVTQVELARRLAKPQSFVSAFEVGKRRVDVIEFLLITQTLGAEPLHVFFADILKSLPAFRAPSRASKKAQESLKAKTAE